jgi:putative hydrolase of the HAD superfamily
MIKAIFFDIDNTLYDSATLTAMARKNSVLAMIDAGLIVPENQILKDLTAIIGRFGPNYHRHYDKLLKLYGTDDPKIIAAGVVAYEHTKNAYLKPGAGVIPTLIELKKRFKLGVISNGLRSKQWEKLVGLGVHHFFSAVITSQECKCEKPSPEIFKIAIKALDVNPDEAVMVGDKYDLDIAGAKKIGMHALWLTKNEPKDTSEINHFSQLIERIEGLE